MLGDVPTLDALIGQVDADETGCLARLADAAGRARCLTRLADGLVGYFVDQARDAGASWKDIGEVLGVSKQAAQQRFSARCAPASAEGRVGA